ncbi:MAG: TolC family protein [Bacteroidetes bacterium]|nr:TolC family protein [Bacteroidota bacterium]
MMKNIRIFPSVLALLLMVFTNVEVYGQKKWTLRECVDYALEHNITVKQNEINSELNEIITLQNKMSLLPNLNASVGRNYNFGRTIDPFTNQFTTQQVESDNWSLSSNVTLFNGFSLQNTLKQSQLNYLAGKSDLQKVKNDISLNVITSYLQVLYAKEQLNVADGRVAQAQQQLDRVRRMVDGGLMVQGNFLDATSQLANEELSKITAENQWMTAKLTLTQLLQLESPEGFEVEDPAVLVPETSVTDMQPAQIFALGEKALPEVKAADIRVQSAEKGVSIAKASYYPRLTAFGQLSSFYSSSSKKFVGGDFNGFFPNGSITSGGDTVLSPDFSTRIEDNPYRDQLDENYNKAFGLSLSIPIFNGLSSQSNVKRARLNLENSKYAAQQTRNVVYQSIQQAHTDAIAAKKRFDATNKSLSAFEEAYQYAEKRFNAGLINSLEFLTANNNLTRTKVELLQAKYDYIFRLKVLDFYAGNPLTF